MRTVFKRKYSNKRENKILKKTIKKALLKYDFHIEIYCLSSENYLKVIDTINDIIKKVSAETYEKKAHNSWEKHVRVIGSLSSIDVYKKDMNSMRGRRFTRDTENCTFIIGKESNCFITEKNKNTHWLEMLE